MLLCLFYEGKDNANEWNNRRKAIGFSDRAPLLGKGNRRDENRMQTICTYKPTTYRNKVG